MPPDLTRPALRTRLLLNAAKAVEDLRLPPRNRLEPLRRDRSGLWSIRIDDQCRRCVRRDGADAFDVEIVDYH